MVVKIRIKLDTKALEGKLAAAGGSVSKAIKNGLRRSAEAVVKQAKLNLTENRSVAFGTLRQAIWYQMANNAKSVTVGPGLGNKATAGPTGSPRNYGVFVERGRAAGKWPPRNVLRAWIQRKLGQDPDEGGLEFLIRRAIGRRGVRARPFMDPAARTVGPKIPAIMAREIAREINRKGSL